MGIICIGFIVFVVVKYLIKSGQNNSKCIQSSQMNALDFEREVVRVLDDFTANYRTKDEVLTKVEYIFAKSFEYRSELDLEKFSKIMSAKITSSLEKNNLMLKMGEEEKKFFNKGISYKIPFYTKGYELVIGIAKTRIAKEFYVYIGVIDKVETEISKMYENLDKIENNDMLEIMRLIVNINEYLDINNLIFKDYKTNDEIFFYKTKKITKQEINKYFKYYEEEGIIKKGIPFNVKVGLYTDKYCTLLVEFLENKGYKITTNLENPEKKENITRYKINIDDWAECVFSETLFSEYGFLILAVIKLNK